LPSFLRFCVDPFLFLPLSPKIRSFYFHDDVVQLRLTFPPFCPTALVRISFAVSSFPLPLGRGHFIPGVCTEILLHRGFADFSFGCSRLPWCLAPLGRTFPDTAWFFSFPRVVISSLSCSLAFPRFFVPGCDKNGWPICRKFLFPQRFVRWPSIIFSLSFTHFFSF